MGLEIIKKVIEVLSRYHIYFVVGIVNTIVAVTLREITGIFLDGYDFGYTISIVISYVAALALCFYLHDRFTFANQHKPKARHSERKITSFIATYFLGMGLTVVFSLGFRQIFQVYNMALVNLHDTMAFVVAALLTSVVTYLINKLFVFKET